MKASKPNDIDDYIAGFPKDTQKILEQIRATIKKAAPDADETIKYAMPTFTLNGNLVYFAASKIILAFILRRQEMKFLKKNFLVTKAEKVRFNFRYPNRCL